MTAAGASTPAPDPVVQGASAPCAWEITGNPAGPTLVFIHGWPDDARLWRRQVAALRLVDESAQPTEADFAKFATSHAPGIGTEGRARGGDGGPAHR